MSFTHSIMFHHFHDEKHLPAQGSLSSTDFSEMLDWLGSRYNLIGAREYLEKFESSTLKENDICLSFDDALLCQYDIAVQVLEECNIDAFFFVYSSVFSRNPDSLEIFRYFRTNNFSDIDDFYYQFFALAETKLNDEFLEHRKVYQSSNYLSAFPFYSENDKWFRYLRDQALGPAHYEELMLHLMNIKGFSPQAVVGDLWISESDLKDIANRGHVVGLHSFNHPTQISKLSYEHQYAQYTKNFEHLSSIVGNVVSMSHPYGDYNGDTLKILEQLGIRIGFRSSLSETKIKGKYEIPRADHANIYKAMKQ